jgi:anti-sigma B factor antagonist
MAASKHTPTPTFELRSTQEGSTAIITLSGDFDMSAKGQFEEALLGIDTERTKRVVVDLRNVTFIDSAGLGMILKGSSACRDLGLAYALVRGPENVQHLLELTALSLSIPIVDEPPVEPAESASA